MSSYAELRSHITKHIVKSLRCGEIVGYRKYFPLSQVLAATSPPRAPIQISHFHTKVLHELCVRGPLTSLIYTRWT